MKEALHSFFKTIYKQLCRNFYFLFFRRTPWLLAHAPGSSVSSFQPPSILPASPGGRCNFVAADVAAATL
jgi:hypothetical protein